MALSFQTIQNKNLSNSAPFIFDFGDTLQQSIVGPAYFKLSYGEDHNYEFSKMALTLANSPTGNAGTSVQTSVTAILEDDDHSINLGESFISLSAIGVVGSGKDYTVQLGTQSNVPSGATETRICDNASPSVQNFAVMMSGFSMAYNTAIHRFWNAKTVLTANDKQDDGLYASITGYCKNDDNAETDENSFNLIGLTTAATSNDQKEPPLLLIKRWKGQHSSDNVPIDFSNDLKNGYVIDTVLVFITDFCVCYADRTGSTDHEITGIGAGCKTWTGSGQKTVTLTQPHAFVWQTGFGEDKQDDSTSYVELLIVVTQRLP
ncbi:hypothetical protein ACWGNA_20555 [Brucella cytisi]